MRRWQTHAHDLLRETSAREAWRERIPNPKERESIVALQKIPSIKLAGFALNRYRTTKTFNGATFPLVAVATVPSLLPPS